MEPTNYNDYNDLELAPTPQAIAWSTMLATRRECLELIRKLKFINKNVKLTREDRVRKLGKLKLNLLLAYATYRYAKRKWMHLSQLNSGYDQDLEYLELNHGQGFAQAMIDKGYLKMKKAA